MTASDAQSSMHVRRGADPVEQPVGDTEGTTSPMAAARTLNLVDPSQDATPAIGRLGSALPHSDHLHGPVIDIDQHAHSSMKGQKACVLWLTGLSGAGKSTIANALQRRLYESGRHSYLLDGDNLRRGLNRDLGFSNAERVENIRRAAEVAKLMVDAGLIVIAAFISPFRGERRMARALFAAGEFIEVFIDTPLAVAESRDPKQLYRKARAGTLANFTGIDSPYEAPQTPEIRIDTTRIDVACAAQTLLDYLHRQRRLTA